MKKRESVDVRSLPPYARVLLLAGVTLLLGFALFSPARSRFPGRKAPLEAPFLPDEPVVRHYK